MRNILKEGTIIKALLCCVLLSLSLSVPVFGKDKFLRIEEYKAESANSRIILSFRVNMDSLELPSMSRLALIPVIRDGKGNEKSLRAILISGRNSHIQYERVGSKDYAEAKEIRRNNGSRQSYDYTEVVPYEPWMEGASIGIKTDDCGCSRSYSLRPFEKYGEVNYDPFGKVEYMYWMPSAEKIKERSIEGSAYIDYPQDKSEIYPDYMNNMSELQKVNASLSEALSGRGEILRIELKSTASPEGRYGRNVVLSQERSESMKRYIVSLLSTKSPEYVLSSVPEDWDGFRRMLSESKLSDKESILRLSESNKEADAKERQIAKEHPESYVYISEQIYPKLRRTDYKVVYTVKSYSVEESRSEYGRNPSNLSSEELYLLAESYGMGSAESDGILLTAALLYPESDVANVNAANVSLRKRDVEMSEKFLSKCTGEEPSVLNAKGALCFLKGDIDGAGEYWQKAVSMGSEEAKRNLEIL